MKARPKPYHHGDLRRALFDAVLVHVEEVGGTGQLTLREAARRAGVSHSAPYRHFPDKDALLAAVAAEGFAKLSAALRDARADALDNERRFIRTGLAYLRFALERRGFIAVMFGPEVAKSHTRVLQQNANDAFTVLQEMAADAGVIDGAEARRVGTVIWSFLHGLAILARQNQVPSSVAETTEGLATLGLRSLFRDFRRQGSSTKIRRRLS